MKTWGMLLVLMLGCATAGWTQSVLTDPHANPARNVRPLSPRESPTPHNFSLQNPPKVLAAPKNPRLVLPPMAPAENPPREEKPSDERSPH